MEATAARLVSWPGYFPLAPIQMLSAAKANTPWPDPEAIHGARRDFTVPDEVKHSNESALLSIKTTIYDIELFGSERSHHTTNYRVHTADL